MPKKSPESPVTFEVLQTNEQGFAANVQRAVDWYSSHSGRDACDAATAAVMSDKHVTAHGCGQGDWPRFLDAVKEAIRAAEPPF